MEKIYIFLSEYKEKFEIVPSPKGGWVVKKPFMLIDKNLSPVEGVTLYEGKVIRTIVDKRGIEIPIIGNITPHTCNPKCGEKCNICGKKLDHDFEVVEFSTETECEKKRYTCKRCGFTEETKGYNHYFKMQQEGVLTCDFCGFSKPVEVTDEIIREYAVPPFPLEKALQAWGLTMEEIFTLHQKCKQIQNIQVTSICYTYSDKLEKSIQFWNKKRISYDEFLKIIPRDIIEFQRKNQVRIKRRDSYFLVSADDEIFFDEKTLQLFIWKVDNIEMLPTQSEYRWSTSYSKIVLYELSDISELLQILDIYDKETTFAKKREIDDLYKNAKHKYEIEKAIKEQAINELKKDPIFRKLYDFLSDSLYGEKILYTVDPYNGYFRGAGMRFEEITDIFFEGVKLLNLQE